MIEINSIDFEQLEASLRKRLPKRIEQRPSEGWIHSTSFHAVLRELLSEQNCHIASAKGINKILVMLKDIGILEWRRLANTGLIHIHETSEWRLI